TASNYTITYHKGTLTVNTAALDITATDKTKTYGQTVTFAGAEFTSSGLQNGETIGSVALSSTGAAATAVVGSYDILVSDATGGTFTASNYTTTYHKGTLTITKAMASVTPDAKMKTYGDLDPTLTGTLVGFVASDNVTASYSRTAGENAGSYTISATLSPLGV